MTTIEAAGGVGVPHSLGGRRMRAGVAIGVHLVVDLFSFIIIALMPLLSARLGLSKVEVAVLIGLGSITSGGIQPIVALLSDRFDTRIIGTIGMALALVCICSIGFATEYWHVLVLHGVGAAGVGAFHPPAAAVVGALARTSRARSMAFFFLAGMTGGVLGNLLAPAYVETCAARSGSEPDVAFGLRSLIWLLPFGLASAAVLGWAIHRVSHKGAAASDFHSVLTQHERKQRWFAVGVLYVGNMIRFSVNMALVYLIVEWTTRLATSRLSADATVEHIGIAASRLNGPLQGAQQVGMGLGGLTLGMLLAPRLEKPAFVLLPFVGAAAVMTFPISDGLPQHWVMPIAFLLTVVAGFGFGGMVPISMSVAQRLLPHRTSLASGLMLGGAWMVAFLGPQFAGAMQTWFGLENAFRATAMLLAAAGFLSLMLPRDVLMGSTESRVTTR